MRNPAPSTPKQSTRRANCEGCNRHKTLGGSTDRKSAHSNHTPLHTPKTKRSVKTSAKSNKELCEENNHINTEINQNQLDANQETEILQIHATKNKSVKKITKIPRPQNVRNSTNDCSTNGEGSWLLPSHKIRDESQPYYYDDIDEESVMAALGTQLRSSNSNGGISRLSMMQAKFQEKLMLEKESRLLEMAARQEAEREDIINRVTKTSANSLSSSMSSLNSSGAGQGRVRRMFEERRNNSRGYHQSPKGYDKSFPLDPVRRDGGGRPPAKGGRGHSMDRAPTHMDEPHMNRSRSQVAFQRVNRGDSRIQKPPKPHGKAFPTHHKSTSSLMDGNSMYNGYARVESPVAPSSTKSSPGPRGPPITPQRRPPTRNPPPQQKKPGKSNFLTVNGGQDRKSRSPSPSPREPTPSKGGFLSRLGIGTGKPSNKNSSNSKSGSLTPRPRLPAKDTLMINNLNPLSRSAPPTPRAITPVPSHLRKCHYCERNFDPDRILKHEEICKKNKVKAKKRKIFDPVQMRTKGTEAEKFVARGDHLKQTKKVKKKDWRREHENFIQTVRAAKGMPGYEAPPMDTSDYVECPHCGRKFSDKVADRHIPKCADIQSNKSFRKPDQRGPTPAVKAPSRLRR